MDLPSLAPMDSLQAADTALVLDCTVRHHVTVCKLNTKRVFICLPNLCNLRAVSDKNGASRPRVDFVQICDCPYDLGFGEKLGKITIKNFSSHLGDHQLLRAYIGSI